MSNCWLDIYNLTYDMYIRDFILFFLYGFHFTHVVYGYYGLGIWQADGLFFGLFVPNVLDRLASSLVDGL
jgi:hypothetical protein